MTCDRSVAFTGASDFLNKKKKKFDRHDITEILLKVALNTIKPTNQPTITSFYAFIQICLCMVISRDYEIMTTESLEICQNKTLVQDIDY